jgi:hypothetical protein
MSETVETSIYVAVRAHSPDSVLVVPGGSGWSLPCRTYSGNEAFDDVADGILTNLGAEHRQSLSFVQCVTIGRPSRVAILFVSRTNRQPSYTADRYEWLDLSDLSPPVDALSAHFILESLRLNSEPYVDLGLRVPRVEPLCCYPVNNRLRPAVPSRPT